MSDTEAPTAVQGEVDPLLDHEPTQEPTEGPAWWLRTWVWVVCLVIVAMVVGLVLLGSATGAGAAGDCGGG